MFGSLLPIKSELRVRELESYQACYCGLCHAIKKRFGNVSRFTLNYDCTFLALILLSLNENNRTFSKRCALHCLHGKRKICTVDKELEYVADVNVLLVYYKLLDDWHDEKKVSALFAIPFLYYSARKAKKKSPQLDAVIKDQLTALSYLESHPEMHSIDEFAEPFAVLLRRVLEIAPGIQEKDKLLLGWLGYYLGRWIYLLDAWEDRSQDKSKKCFNPMNYLGISEEKVSFLLHICLTETEKTLDLIDLGDYSEIINNIVRLSCRERTKKALLKELEAS